MTPRLKLARKLASPFGFWIASTNATFRPGEQRSWNAPIWLPCRSNCLLNRKTKTQVCRALNPKARRSSDLFTPVRARKLLKLRDFLNTNITDFHRRDHHLEGPIPRLP